MRKMWFIGHYYIYFWKLNLTGELKTYRKDAPCTSFFHHYQKNSSFLDWIGMLLHLPDLVRVLWLNFVVMITVRVGTGFIRLLEISRSKRHRQVCKKTESRKPGNSCTDMKTVNQIVMIFYRKKKLFILIKLWINATLINVLQVEKIEIYLEIKSEC